MTDDWIVPPSDVEEELAQPSPRRSLGWKTTAGLLGAGLVVGVGAMLLVNQGSGGSTSAGAAAPTGSSSSSSSGAGQGRQGFDGPRDGGPGGVAGEEHVQGTLTAIATSSITVKTSSASATYAVTSSTEIRRNGATVTLSQLRVGDPVFVHVLPAASGATKRAERIFAGTMPARGGFPGGGGGPGDAGPGDDNGGTQPE